MNINVVFDKELLDEGFRYYISWNYIKNPHMLVFGSTGSGKTYLVKLLLGRIGLKLDEVSITVCDYKADDFRFLEGSKNYYSFADCFAGLTDFYNKFLARQEGVDTKKNFKLLCFDEWASFLNSLEKKEAETAKQKLSTLLMLGRSFNIHVLISQQRGDTQYFNTARDNFSIVVGLGNLSKESLNMFFSDYKEHMSLNNSQGQGYMLIDGQGLKHIQVPRIRNMATVEHYIKLAVSR